MAYRKQNDKNWNNKEIVDKELWTRNAQNNSYAGAPPPQVKRRDGRLGLVLGQQCRH